MSTLPRPGGIFDQDARLMYLMNCVYQSQAEREVLEAKKRQGELEAQQRQSRR